MSKILIGKYEATIYPEDDGYTGAISLGFDGKGNRQAHQEKGQNKGSRQGQAQGGRQDLEAGIKASGSATRWRMRSHDWLAKGLKGRDDNTVTTNRILAEQHVIPLIGATKLKRADRRRRGRVARRAHRQALDQEPARSARDPQAGDTAGAGPGQGAAERGRTGHHTQRREGRPSQAMTLEQATAMLEQAKAVTAARLRRREPAHRHPHRRGPRPALVSRGGVGRRGRGGGRSPRPGSITSGSPSTSGARSGPTATPRPRSPAGHWNCRPRRPRRSAAAPHAPGKRAACGGSALARSRPRVRQPGRNATRRFPRQARVQGDHQEGRPGENWTPRELRTPSYPS